MFKWFCMIFKLFFPLTSILTRLKKYIKHKDKYPLQFRYDEVRNFMLKLQKATKKKIEVHNYEIMDKPHGGRIYVMNHISMDDICTMIQISQKPLHFISKIENEKAIAIGTGCKGIDAYFIDRNDARQSLRVLKQAADAAKHGEDIFLFPEGTRSKTGEVLEFKSALNNLINMAKVEVVLMAIDNTPKTFSKKEKYKPFTVKVRICEPISYEEYLEKKDDFAEYARQRVAAELAIIRKGE